MTRTFAWGVQISLGQIGGVVGPQQSQSRWVYKNSFGITMAGVITATGVNISLLRLNFNQGLGESNAGCGAR